VEGRVGGEEIGRVERRSFRIEVAGGRAAAVQVDYERHDSPILITLRREPTYPHRYTQHHPKFVL